MDGGCTQSSNGYQLQSVAFSCNQIKQIVVSNRIAKMMVFKGLSVGCLWVVKCESSDCHLPKYSGL